MRKSFKFLTFSITASALILAAYILARKDDHKNTPAIPNSALVGFNKCDISEEAKYIENYLITHGKPTEKRENFWVYAMTGQLMGFPINFIEIGVCNDSGERSCGWGYYTGFILDAPKETVRKILVNKYGIDYTVAQRDEEFDATLRPLLSGSTPTKNSILFCDPGSL